MNKTLKRCADKMSSDKISEPSSQAARMNVSEIAEFYKGQNVLLTGGTGFIGLLIIEKLMRSCPDIANLYMLIRPKKGKSVKELFKKCFDDFVSNAVQATANDSSIVSPMLSVSGPSI